MPGVILRVFGISEWDTCRAEPCLLVRRHPAKEMPVTLFMVCLQWLIYLHCLHLWWHVNLSLCLWWSKHGSYSLWFNINSDLNNVPHSELHLFLGATFWTANVTTCLFTFANTPTTQSTTVLNLIQNQFKSYSHSFYVVTKYVVLWEHVAWTCIRVLWPLCTD